MKTSKIKLLAACLMLIGIAYAGYILYPDHGGGRTRVINKNNETSNDTYTYMDNNGSNRKGRMDVDFEKFMREKEERDRWDREAIDYLRGLKREQEK